MLNLPPAPPGFRGLHPDLPVTVYYRHLPHWRQEGASYFVTVRLADALPQEKLKYLKQLRLQWERLHPPPRSDEDWKEFAREVTRRVEAWTDEGYGACWFGDPRWAGDLRERLFHFQDVRYLVSCYVIMPNHCHLVIRPFDGQKLESILRAMKGVVARHINAAHGGAGALWQEESYDRMIRDEEHLWRVVQYVGRNPRLAGLAVRRAGVPVLRCPRWIHPDWQAAGWNFIDE